jgi:hypothetical protein
MADIGENLLAERARANWGNVLVERTTINADVKLSTSAALERLASS